MDSKQASELLKIVCFLRWVVVAWMFALGSCIELYIHILSLYYVYIMLYSK